MASKIKVDTLETGDGTGSIIVNNPATFTGAVTATTDMVVHAGGSARKMFMGISSDDLAIGNYSGGNTVRNEHLKITSDGRGLSQFTAKAWVSFNGMGTVAIRDSHNVSSITDNGTGLYRVNFSNAMSNADYSIGGSVVGNTQSYGFVTTTASATSAPTTSGFECAQRHPSTGFYDVDWMHLIVFGD